MIKCGAAQIAYTPRLGTNIPGYFEQRIADDILDDLCARAVVFDDGCKTAGILMMDLVNIPAAAVRKIRARIQDFGIDGANIMIAATHSHTATAMDVTAKNYDHAEEKDVDYICARAADAVYLAYRHRTEVRIGFGTARENEISFNRRWWMKDGKVHTWPGVCNPDNIRPAAGIDPEIGIVRVDNLAGEPVAVLVNFANHPDTVGGTAHCADYIGALSRKLRASLGEKVVPVFMNGCCGDITHIDYSGKHPIVKDHHIMIGNKLAADVLEAYGSICPQEIGSIDVVSKTIEIPRRQFTKDEYEAALKNAEEINARLRTRSARADQSEEDFAKPTTGDMDVMALEYAESAITLYEHPILSENVELQAIRVGDIAFSSMPGEMLVEIGLDFKKRSPFAKNFIVELANGCNGYIGTKKSFPEGGYEVTLSSYVNLCEDAAEMINSTLVELLQGMR